MPATSKIKIEFPWPLYVGIMAVIKVLWIDLSLLSFFALCITVHQFLFLFYSVGYILPIRYLAGSFMCLQMLLGPAFAFNGLDAFQRSEYRMKVSETEYFEYAIPAVCLFIAGLHFFDNKRYRGEIINEERVKNFVDQSGNLPFILIGIGFLSSIIASFFSTELGFVFYLLSSFKFVGAFMLLYAGKQLKSGSLLLVLGSIIATSLARAMFHDLLTWIIMIGFVVALKYKPNIRIKALVAVAFIILAVIIQTLKGDYRKSAWGGGESGLDTFEDTFNKKQEEGAIFKYDNIASSNLRINQGFIVTNIMSNVPDRVPYSNGEELYQIIEAAFLPRVLAPNKLNAGDRTLFMKYSGMRIKKGVSMGLSSLGDAYINFGPFGGSIMMFFLGALFSTFLSGFHKHSKNYPALLLFLPMVFYYPIRPDCELQTSLGHLVKATFLIYIVMTFFKRSFKKEDFNISRLTASAL